MLVLDAENTDMKVPLETDDQGVVRVSGTRVSLASIVADFHRGSTPEQIIQNYDAVRLEDAYAVVAYYLRHQETVDAILEAEHAEDDRIQKEAAIRFPQLGIRDRLSKRKQVEQ